MIRALKVVDQTTLQKLLKESDDLPIGEIAILEVDKSVKDFLHRYRSSSVLLDVDLAVVDGHMPILLTSGLESRGAGSGAAPVNVHMDGQTTQTMADIGELVEDSELVEDTGVFARVPSYVLREEGDIDPIFFPAQRREKKGPIDRARELGEADALLRAVSDVDGEGSVVGERIHGILDGVVVVDEENESGRDAVTDRLASAAELGLDHERCRPRLFGAAADSVDLLVVALDTDLLVEGQGDGPIRSVLDMVADSHVRPVARSEDLVLREGLSSEQEVAQGRQRRPADLGSRIVLPRRAAILAAS